MTENDFASDFESFKADDERCCQRELNQLLEKMHLKARRNIKPKVVSDAFWFAQKAHGPQKRKSGEPYFIHPLAAANILADYGFGSESISATLLHDVIEDANVTPKELREKFGDKITELVEGVTKLAQLSQLSEEKRFAGDLQQTLFASAKDLRVIIIKLADQLHNMRTLKHLQPAVRKKYAQKCLDIYAPIAHKLGLHDIKNELENLAFRYSLPEEYKEFEQKLKKERHNKQSEINRVVKKLKSDFKAHNIKSQFIIKPKATYSLYNKMVHTGKTFDEIEDTMILVIVMDTIDDCYQVLGRVHQKFKPRPRKIKDFIAVPQNDFYQSLHTTIVGDKGEIVKVYIRTQEMENIRKNGIIHFMLADTQSKEFGKSVRWFGGLRQLSKDFKGEHFLEALKTDYLSEAIPVLTPKGEVIELPKGSTPLDFAYIVDTKLGNHCKTAKVNERPVPLWHGLEAGDKVEIIAGKKSKVKLEWLNFVKSKKAVRKIKQALKNQRKAALETDLANLRIKMVDKPGVLFKVTKVIALADLNILSVNSDTKGNPHSCDMTLRFDEQKKLEKAVKQIEAMDEVLEIKYLLV